ncbi:MAG: PAS domain-containing protein [Deltaproteobacteria bacterium]|nr:PAS domain-containing protein [Deltaproteobacteria bacterium]
MGNNHMSDRLALDVLEQLPTPVMAVDSDLKIIFMNAAGRGLLGMSMDEIEGNKCADLMNSKHCGTPECRMKQAMEKDALCTARNEVNIDGKVIPIEYSAAPLKDDQGNIVGGLEYVLDITERVRHENKLMEQSRTIREISTPAIKLWDRIVVLPVVGVVDSMRAWQMMETMLTKITETSSKVIIMDIQGVAAVDTAVANHLIRITKATKLMGCKCIISGISSAVAQTLVQLGIDLGEVVTHSTLQDALTEALAMLNQVITKMK